MDRADFYFSTVFCGQRVWCFGIGACTMGTGFLPGLLEGNVWLGRIDSDTRGMFYTGEGNDNIKIHSFPILTVLSTTSVGASRYTVPDEVTETIASTRHLFCLAPTIRSTASCVYRRLTKQPICARACLINIPATGRIILYR